MRSKRISASAGRGGALPRRRGVVLIYGAVALVAFAALCLLAVDFGRVQLVKGELQNAADAAARAGAAGFDDGTAVNKAVQTAAQNFADGRAVVLTTSGADPDVVFGYWDEATRQFTAGGSPSNAMRVTARRTQARGNAVSMPFGQVLGVNTADVRASAIVARKKGSSSGFVGTAGVRVGNNSLVAGYDSVLGPPGVANVRDTAAVGSNQGIDFGSNSVVRGDVVLGPGADLNTGNNFTQTGGTTNLTSALSFPPTESPTVSSSGALYVGQSQTHTLAAGTYHFTSVTLDNGASIQATGPVTIYVTGSVQAENDAGLRAYGDQPANLRVRLVGAAGFNAGNNFQATADIYGPGSVFGMGNDGLLNGSAVVREFDAGNNSVLYHDISSSNGTPDSVRLVG